MLKPLKPLNITYLISSWLSISMIFLIGEVVVRFGVFSSLVIVCAFILAFGGSLVLQKLLNLSSAAITIKGSLMGDIISVFRFLEVFVLHFFVSGLIFHSMFQMNIYISVFFTVIIVAAFFFFRPISEKLQLSIKNTKFIVVSGLAIILPTYIYLQKGLESLYHNLLYYQPQVLNHESKGLWLLFLAAFFIFLSKLLFQGEAPKYISPSFKKGISKLFIAVFIFCTFILAFATMNIVAITQNLKVSHANELFILLIEKLSSPVAFNVFCLFLYFATLLILIDALSAADNKIKYNPKINTSFVLILISAFITIAIFHRFTILVVYAFFGFLISILIMAVTFIKIIRKYMSRKSN